jgi:hypothetical protein
MPMGLLLSTCHSSEQLKEDVRGEKCNIHEDNKICMKNFCLENCSEEREDNIKVELKYIGR